MARSVSRDLDFSTRHPQGRQRSFAFRSPPNLSGLYPFQKAGVRWLRAHPSRAHLLCDEMGLGKTVQALRAQPSHRGMLVVCPAFLMRTWRDAARAFCPELDTVMGALYAPRPGELVIESYDSLPAPPSIVAKSLLPREDFSNVTVVLDEVQYAKTPEAARTHRARLLAAQAGRVIGMTGTPIDNSPLDLWGILQTLGLEREVFGYDAWNAFKAIFKARWITFVKGGAGSWRFGKPKENVRAMLDPFMLRRMRADVLPDLPGKTYQNISVDVSTEALARILDDAESAWTDVNDLPPFEVLSTARRVLAEAKTPYACAFVAEMAREHPVVVFSAHTGPVLAIGKLAGAETITGETPDGERAARVERFQRGEFPILALTIGAGGVGITLTHAWHAIFVDRAYTPGANAQAEDRLARIGQRSNVLVTRLVSAHPIDVRLNKILDHKQRINVATLG